MLTLGQFRTHRSKLLVDGLPQHREIATPPCEQFVVTIRHQVLPHTICPAHRALESVFGVALLAPTSASLNAAGAACHVLMKPPIPAPSLLG